MSSYFICSHIERPKRILEKASAEILTFHYTLILFATGLLAFVHFLFNLTFLLSFVIFANPLTFTALAALLELHSELRAELLDKVGSIWVLGPGSMLFEIDMLVVILKPLLADLTKFGVRLCNIEILGGWNIDDRGNFMNTTLNFFFELVFLIGGIVIVVFLY